MALDRRSLFTAGLGAALTVGAGRALAQAQGSENPGGQSPYPGRDPDTYPADQPPPPPPGAAYPQQPAYSPAPAYQTPSYPPQQGYGQQGYGQQPYSPPAYREPYAAPMNPVQPDSRPYGPGGRAEPYSHDEIVHNVSDFFGVAAETAGGVVEHVFEQNGLPTGYIAGEEASGAFGIGLRYGKGLLYMKHRPPMRIYWRGPSIGWDVGGNASRVFTLCYNLQYPEAMLQRFPGVDGSIYVVAGLGVNYQRANDITLAPIRSGVGLRAGANIGYLAYSRNSHWFPF